MTMNLGQKNAVSPAAGPSPKPELGEGKLPDPGLRDLTFADWKAVFIRAAKSFMNNNANSRARVTCWKFTFANARKPSKNFSTATN